MRSISEIYTKCQVGHECRLVVREKGQLLTFSTVEKWIVTQWKFFYLSDVNNERRVKSEKRARALSQLEVKVINQTKRCSTWFFRSFTRHQNNVESSSAVAKMKSTRNKNRRDDLKASRVTTLSQCDAKQLYSNTEKWEIMTKRKLLLSHLIVCWWWNVIKFNIARFNSNRCHRCERKFDK